MDTDVCKKEVLTPPDSPRDEELITPPNSPKGVFIKLFDGTEEVIEWNKIKFEACPDGTDDSSTVSEKSFGIDDEFSEDCAPLSPCLVLVIDSDEDEPYYKPQSNNRRSNKRIMTNVNKKSYARQMQDDRKVRKKVSDARKQRKMEKNKIAATRYRLKKKQELEKSKHEEDMLNETNKKLRNQFEMISREVACVKSLLREVYGKRGSPD